MPELEWISLGPASRLLGVDPDTLRRWSDVGRIRSFTTPGGHRRFARTEVARLQEARRTTRRPLATLGATPERMARAYARSYRAAGSAPAADGLAITDRDAFRVEGRRLIEALVAYLDATTPAAREAAEATAMDIVAATAGRLGESRVDAATAIGAFVAARRPFLAELESIGRRRALEAPDVMGLYAQATALLDRLLLHFVASFQA
ncbi:MAG: helix-turn-helix domain-containing protein [Chloroflexota bacterium]